MTLCLQAFSGAGANVQNVQLLIRAYYEVHVFMYCSVGMNNALWVVSVLIRLVSGYKMESVQGAQRCRVARA